MSVQDAPTPNDAPPRFEAPSFEAPDLSGSALDAAPAAPPQVTDRAFARLAEIAAQAGGPQCLRVAVEGGGCSGFQYDIRLEEAAAEDDLVMEKDGQKVLIDSVSLPFLAGAVIDFTEELIGARFAVENPNAASSCGCGTSFAL